MRRFTFGFRVSGFQVSRVGFSGVGVLCLGISGFRFWGFGFRTDAGNPGALDQRGFHGSEKLPPVSGFRISGLGFGVED